MKRIRREKYRGDVWCNWEQVHPDHPTIVKVRKKTLWEHIRNFFQSFYIK